MKTGLVLLLLFLGSIVYANAQEDFDAESVPPPQNVMYDKAPEPIRMIQAKYPSSALQKGIEGKVWVSLWVTRRGTVWRAAIIKTDSPLLNQAAIDAAVQWIFSPAMIRNKPVSVWIQLPFRFSIPD